MRTIADQWNSYRKAVVPADASPVQVQETRRAFYAGAQAMLGLLNTLSDDDVSEEAGAAVLQGLHDEASLFAHEVLAGRA